MVLWKANVALEKSLFTTIESFDNTDWIISILTGLILITYFLILREKTD